MKAYSLFVAAALFTIFIGANATADENQVVVNASFYGLSQALKVDADHKIKNLWTTNLVSTNKIHVSVSGAGAHFPASQSSQCKDLSPRLDLELTALGRGKTQVRVLPTTSLNGNLIGKMKYELSSLNAVALEPANAAVHSFSLTATWGNPEDEEEQLVITFTVSELAATLKSHNGDDDSGSVFEVVAVAPRFNKAKRTLTKTQIVGTCY